MLRKRVQPCLYQELEGVIRFTFQAGSLVLPNSLANFQQVFTGYCGYYYYLQNVLRQSQSLLCSGNNL